MCARRVSLHAVPILLSSWFLVGCGGGDDGVVPGGDDDDGAIPDAGAGLVEVPLGQSLPPLAYALALDYDVSLNFSPEAIGGHLFLDVGDDGSVDGVASARVEDRVGLQTVTGEVRGSHLVLQWSDLVVPPGGLLGFEELRLWLLDDDGDGSIDGARGEGTGEWGSAGGIDHSLTQHESVLIATLDQGETEARLNQPFRDGTVVPPPHRDVAFPHDELWIDFGEPLREADVVEHLRVLVGGNPLAGQIALEPVDGFVARATFQPDRFLPFGAELRLDLSELTDVAGNRLSDRSDRLEVIGNPGPLGDNLGFESGLNGWYTFRRASTQGAVDGFAPAEGAAQAVLSVGATLGAVLELPADATELELSITTLTRLNGSSRPPVGIRLHRPGGEAIEIDTTPLDDSFRDCETCAFYEWQNGPVRLTASLAGIEAGPAVLEVDTFRGWPAVEDEQVFLIDDIQVR